MFETSRDVLNITLSVCASVLTILLAWLLIYCIRAMHTMVMVSRRVDEIIHLAEDTLEHLRDRARDLASVLPLLAKMVEKLVTYLGERKRKRKSTTTPEPINSKS